MDLFNLGLTQNIVYQTDDEQGSIEVIDYAQVRSLHFGTAIQQSALFLHDPLPLVFFYCRYMMLACVFNPQPKNVLMLGLGGGSMVTFLMHHFPALQIDAVEYREVLGEIAHRYFSLPDEPRLSLHYADAATHMHHNDREYDLIFVDVFDHKGMEERSVDLSFYSNCRAALSVTGVACINLWSGDEVLYELVSERLSQAFDGNVYFLPMDNDDSNVIAFAFAGSIPLLHQKQLQKNALHLGAQFGLSLKQYFNRLRKHNTKQLDVEGG